MSITSDVLTIRAASELKARLQKLIDSLYQTSGSLQEKISSLLTEEEYNRLIQYSRDNNINLADPQSVQKLLQNTHNDLAKRPIMSLTVAFSPSHTYVRELTQWLSLHGPGPVLINIETNPDIVAGAVINYQGKIFDYSYIRRQQHDQL